MEKFYPWMANHFVMHISPRCPIVLLLGGHPPNIDLYIIEFCANNDIFLFQLPRQSFHALQDFSEHLSPIFLKNLKNFLSIIKVFLSQKGHFLEFLQKCWSKCAVQTFKLLKTLCRVSGIWPINRFNTDHNLFNPGKIYTEAP